MVVELRVQELTARDAGHGLVRLSRTAMENLEDTEIVATEVSKTSRE